MNDLLSKEIDVLTVQQEINTQARADIDRSQREYFLRQQLKAIQSELGEGNELFEEIESYRDKILKIKMPENAEEEALRQLKKLERMHPDTAETATLRNWLDIMTDCRGQNSKDNLNLKKAEKILDEDHYGLERVKERIVEALAVRKLMEKPKGSILCLVGPPGVGKTPWAFGCASFEPQVCPAFVSAVCTTKPRSAVIVEPMSARCPDELSRRFNRRRQTIH